MQEKKTGEKRNFEKDLKAVETATGATAGR